MTKEHVKIYSGHAIFVNRLRAILNDSKIPALIKDQVESARLGGFGVSSNSVGLFVFSADAEKATKIIKKFEQEITE